MISTSPSARPGSFWEPAPGVALEVHKDYFLKHISNPTDQHMQAILRAWQDWLKFHGVGAEQFFVPTGMQLALFLD